MPRASFTVPTPRPDGGPKIYLNGDGTITCSYDVPKRKLAHDAQPRTRPVRYGRDQQTQNPAYAPDADPVGELVKLLQGAGLDQEASARACELIKQIAGSDIDPDTVPPELDSDAYDAEPEASTYQPSAAGEQPRLAGDAAARQRRAREVSASQKRLSERFADFNRIRQL
jgi:hypothetical protein